MDFRARHSNENWRLMRAFSLDFDDGWDAFCGRVVLTILAINVIIDGIGWFV